MHLGPTGQGVVVGMTSGNHVPGKEVRGRSPEDLGEGLKLIPAPRLGIEERMKKEAITTQTAQDVMTGTIIGVGTNAVPAGIAHQEKGEVVHAAGQGVGQVDLLRLSTYIIRPPLVSRTRDGQIITPTQESDLVMGSPGGKVDSAAGPTAGGIIVMDAVAREARIAAEEAAGIGIVLRG